MVKLIQNIINKKKLFERIVLLLCFLSFINADIQRVDYNPSELSGEYTHNKGSKVQTVELIFSNEREIPYYIKVTVTPEKDIATPLLCFSPTDANCKSDVHTMIKKTDGRSSSIFIRKEEFIGSQLYVLVTCEENSCSYTLRFEGGQSAEIDANSVFSYVVNSHTREMKFQAMGTIEDSGYLTIGIEGSSTIQIDVENVEDTEYPDYYLGIGRVVTIPIYNSNSNILATFSIKGANVGDYLTLNTHIVSNWEAPDNLLYPNGPVVMGVLSGREGYFREECFPISDLISEKYKNINKYYLTGKIYSKYALFWLADEKNMFMEETEQEIYDGYLSYFIENNGQKRSVCFEFSYESTVNMGYVAYSISILEYTSLETIYNFYPPQTLGQFYRRMIPKGGYAVYHGAKIDKNDKRLNFNMYSRKGVAEMYVTKCYSYPNCIYDTKSLTYTKPKKINRMTIWETNLDKDYEALGGEKYVMIVYCKDEDNEQKGYCEVDTAVDIPGKTVTLIEKQQYSKFVLKGDKGLFQLDLKAGKKIQRLTVDIMIYSGDVSFNFHDFDNKLNNGKLGDEEIEISHYKYFLSNKIFYHFNLAQLAYDDFEIEYEASLNSFFTIKYEIDPSNINPTEEKILSDESYLVQIDPTITQKSKKIYLPNYRVKTETPFLANFFALNCDFAVRRKDSENEIAFFDGYAQEIIYFDSKGYKSDEYEYNITIKEADLSNYNHKMCMIYVAGYESPDTASQTEIVVAENVNQQIIFEDKFRSIRFLYPQADPSKDLAININIIDQAFYNIKIYINNEEKPLKEYTITRSQIYYISGNDILGKCSKDTLCSIIVEATFSQYIPNLENTETPMIEITIRQILNTPSYLQKSQAKKDFTCGDRFYYLYTEIGKNENGEVLVNFLRDFGNVYGKIVRKDQSSPDEDPNWRNMYRMPSLDWEDSFHYNGYIKKFQVTVDDTKECIEGCYLLLSIQISQIGDYADDSKFYPFSIITNITPNNRAYTDIPKVVIQVNEYIVGNVDLAENERIYQFYEVWLTHDSYKVEFDFQSEVAGLYISLGGIRPTTKNADFKLLPPGRDSILSIDKFNILQKAESKNIKVPNQNSLQDINLVIGVWTDKTDSIDTEVFSLAVRLPNKDISLDIVEVNTDQKILCSPKYLNDNQFRCLFMVIYDEEDVENEMDLIIHGSSVNQSAITYVHANFIERIYYDEYDVNSLRTKTPTLETAEYSTQKNDKDYIYTNLKLGSKKYFFVNVITDKEDDIFIFTSIPTYNVINKDNYQFYPNPSTEQLLSVSVEKLRLKFFTDSSLIVNIVTLGGEAMISWADDLQTVFNLRGRGDRLTLTSGKTSDEIIITKRTTNDKLNSDEDQGFIFYVSYYIRNQEQNFDEVSFGKSVEVSYRETDLPVYLYSKISSYYNDLNVAITFRDSEINTEGELAISPINIKASLAKESSVYKSKQNPELAPSFDKAFIGKYDPALKTAIVFLSSDVIKNYNIKLEDNPTIYLSMEKNPDSSEINYSKFNIEAQFTRINGGIIPVEKTFNYGRHSNYMNNFYRLKRDLNRKFMAIEIAFNSDKLNFAIGTSSMARANISEIIHKEEKVRGKVFVLLNLEKTTTNFIYLNIFKKTNDQNLNPVLFNYVFKYVTIDKEDDFQDYRILENNNELKINEKKDDKTNLITIDCTFNKIDLERDKANITYFFKVVDNSTLYYGEEPETIAVMESPYYTIYKRNPIDNDGTITLTAKGDFKNWAYLQVIAQIQQDTILEYVAYKGIKNIRAPQKNNDEESSGISTSVFIAVAVILLLLIGGLAVVVFIFQQKNKSLINQVKHVSFQQNAGGSNTNTDPDLLLQKSQQ